MDMGTVFILNIDTGRGYKIRYVDEQLGYSLWKSLQHLGPISVKWNMKIEKE